MSHAQAKAIQEQFTRTCQEAKAMLTLFASNPNPGFIRWRPAAPNNKEERRNGE